MIILKKYTKQIMELYRWDEFVENKKNDYFSYYLV